MKLQNQTIAIVYTTTMIDVVQEIITYNNII